MVLMQNLRVVIPNFGSIIAGRFQGQQRAEKNCEICAPQFRKYKLSLEQNRTLLSSDEFIAIPISCKKPFSLPEYLQECQSVLLATSNDKWTHVSYCFSKQGSL